MNIIEMQVSDIIPYPNNPRKNERAVGAVAASIQEFGFKVPIIVDRDNVVIAGHTRLKAAQKLGLETVPVLRADDLTDEQVQALRLADNKTGEIAEWDFEKLEQELAGLELDMSLFGFESEYKYELPEEYAEKASLVDKLVVPPFSVLDARQGYWKERKKKWLDICGDLSETRDGEYGRTSGTQKGWILDMINNGTSNFDPVLTECVYRWFTRGDVKILDPFGGEQTKGVVAGELGMKYVAMEIRADQVEVNQKQTAKYKNVEYYCGDSNHIAEIIKDRDFNLCFTSPPYYDLEIYSKDDLSALGTYEEFMRQYKNIFAQCYDMLEDNSFLVVKVGEIRDKNTGEYRCFVADNIRVMNEIGFKFYDDIVLVTSVGTARLRATRSMKTRKVCKTHQNVLVFYKGDVRKIDTYFEPINCEFEEVEEDGILL